MKGNKGFGSQQGSMSKKGGSAHVSMTPKGKKVSSSSKNEVRWPSQKTSQSGGQKT